ncbi:hypothetical protein EI546_13625 [Aequorivita sp. H23M31]|uniref:Uncharacterized protein n=1 Tax=Aequorivita ciconiae TaxID=2494375 RepID=A0A410G5W9_9FLAO|nr:hypothetical protein [Aequorivita sp. H23M31]QAA82694.1 hypothetical protein EI546_13625 [Aequorivita sp. H23M31]
MKKDQNSSNRGRKFADDIFNEIKKDDILSSAQKVINSAVNVLEEEIAAGILAAKKIEKKVLDVDEIRDDPDDLMNRIRRDTHEAVDLFLDALTALTKQLNKFSDKENKSESGKSAATDSKKSPVLSLIESDRPLHPGETEVFTFSLMEDTADATKISFQKTALFGPNGKTISATAIKVSPSNLVLKPKEEQQVKVQITLPKNAEPGMYNALITDKDNTTVKVVLNIEVSQ